MMPNFESLEPAVDPGNRITFLLDWELTMKCNLDCSYCGTGENGGHDNSIEHPPISECLTTLDFMFAYVDLYMSTKPKGIRYVVLNVYGGESLHHPNIVDILSQVRTKYQPYSDRWHLTVTTTTNAIVSDKKLQKIMPYIDEFTVSYHTECTDKQKQQFKNNLLTIAQAGKRQKCIVLMHQGQELFQDATDMISWLTDNHIKMLPRQLDHDGGLKGNKRIYNESQVQWFDNLYKLKSFGKPARLLEDKKDSHLTEVGRACCGGRQTCTDQNYKQRHYYVGNKFPDWYCSVNHFFLYVRQVNGDIFVNRDCKMKFDGTVGPIGTLANTKEILSTLQNQLATNSLPIIQCKKHNCFCGLCAPKAKNLETYNSIMEKYQKNCVT
jgi:pyruvate-formate lyase-activating enzyme